MKRFLFKLFVFGVVMAIANIAFLKIAQNYEVNFKKADKIHHLKDQEVDILFVGSSLMFDAINADVLEEENISSYNLALAGANLKTNTIQLENYLRHNRPKKIFLGLSQVVRNDLDFDRVLPVVDYYYGAPTFSYREIPMVKFRWLSNELIKRVFSKNHRNSHVHKGQFRTEKTTPDRSKYKNPMDSIFAADAYSNSVNLNKIDSMCVANGIELTVVQMPGNKAAQNAIPIGPLPYTNKFGQARMLYNLNNYKFAEMFDSETDWLTISHLNVSGSTKFTKALIEGGYLE